MEINECSMIKSMREKVNAIYPPQKGRPERKEKARLRIPKTLKKLLKGEGDMLAIDFLTQVKEHRNVEGYSKEWIEISRNMKIALLGKKYSKVFRALQEKGYIEAYKVNGNCEYYRKGGWEKIGGQYKEVGGWYGQCKMYRLNEKLTEDVRRGKVAIVELMVSVTKMKKRISLLKDMTDMKDDAAVKLKQNFAKLDKIDLKDLSYKGMVNAEKTNQRIVDANRQNESGRLFSVLLQGGSREVKERYKYKGDKLNELDMKSARVQLIAALLPEPYKKAYLKWLRELESEGTDPYMFFVKGKKTEKKRKRMKVVFEQAISGIGKGEDVRRILDFFRRKFPPLWMTINASGQDGNEKTQMKLQKIEASIMLPAYLAADFEICLIRHDCLMVRDSDRKNARELIDRICMEKIGYTIPCGDSPPADC